MTLQLKDNIRRFRKSHNMSQEELARYSGVTVGTIGRLERGAAKDPHLSTLVSIAQVFQVSILELVYGKEVTK